jgi:hypothetical protein
MTEANVLSNESSLPALTSGDQSIAYTPLPIYIISLTVNDVLSLRLARISFVKAFSVSRHERTAQYLEGYLTQPMTIAQPNLMLTEKRRQSDTLK